MALCESFKTLCEPCVILCVPCGKKIALIKAKLKYNCSTERRQ